MALLLATISSTAFAATGIAKNTAPNAAIEPERCSTNIRTSTVTNSDGSTTQTTNTSVSCDTPQELADFHKFMKSIGMGV